MNKKLYTKLILFLLIITSSFFLHSCKRNNKPSIIDENVRVFFYADNNVINHTVPSIMIGKAGDALELPILELVGYRFDGWFLNDEHLFDEEIFPTENIALTARFTKLEYSLIFETNGGNTIKTELLTYFQYVSLPTPHKDGYIFDGWYYDTNFDNKLNNSYLNMPDYNLTLYARWFKKHTITFMTNCNDIIDDIQAYAGEAIDAPRMPTNKGLYFFGWYDNENYLGQPYMFNAMPNQDMILHAKWGIKQICVKEDFALIDTQPTGGYELMNNIDLLGQLWQPITTFNGMFDGNNNQISDFTINNTLEKIGFFNTNNGTLKNIELSNYSINIEDENLPEILYIGGLASYSYKGVFDNCKITGDISVTTNLNMRTYIGGLVGLAIDTQISNCSFNGNINFKNNSLAHIGGLAGGITGISTLSSCHTSGTINSQNIYCQITPSEDIGGIVGLANAISQNSHINSLHSNMNITLINLRSNNNLGGIIGMATSQFTSKIETSMFNGQINVQINFDSGVFKTGGIIGYGQQFNIDKCYSHAIMDLTVAKNHVYLGGIIGHNKDASIYYSYSLSDLTVYKAKSIFLGGIVGHNENDTNDATIYQSYNEGELEVLEAKSHGYIGGIVGLSNGLIKECYSISSINASRENLNWIESVLHVGGIAGKVETNNEVKHCHSIISICIYTYADIYIGGIVGMMNHNANEALINECYSEGEIKLYNSISYYSSLLGGIVGQSISSSLSTIPVIHSCHSSTNISILSGHNVSAGGIVGECQNGKVYSSFYIGAINMNAQGNTLAGGITCTTNSIEDCYHATECQINGASQKIFSPNKPQEELLNPVFWEQKWNPSTWDFDDFPKLKDKRNRVIWDYNNLTDKGSPTFTF